MTSPGGQIDVPGDDLYAHSLRSQNRAPDFHTQSNGVSQDGWASQDAVKHSQDSMDGASGAFADRQTDRAQAVKGAADGFTGQDQDASKMLQGIGSLIGPIMQAVQGLMTGIIQGATQGLSAGATSLSGMLSSGAQMLSQGLPKGPQTDVLTGKSASGLGLGGAPTAAIGGTPNPLSPTSVAGGSGPHKSDRQDDRESGLKVEPAVGIMPSGMGMGGIPRPLPPREESEKETKAETHAIVTDKPEPAFAQAQIKEV